MLLPLLLGSLTVFITMSIQVIVVVTMIRYLRKILHKGKWGSGSFGFDIYVLGIFLMVLFSGHLAQAAIWASLFIFLNQFNDFATAFYYSFVSFTSLGYGDIVMEKPWRLLGAIEAGNGVLMFGLSTGTMLSVMTFLFAQHKPMNELSDDSDKRN